jgi:hypothetical protein
MSDVLIALIASVPGVLLGVAALMKARRTPAVVKELNERLDRQRVDLDEAREEIKVLTARVDECDAERRALMRENIDLFRRLDKNH